MFLQIEQQYVEAKHELTVHQHRRDGSEAAIAALERQRAQAVAEFRKSLACKPGSAGLGEFTSGWQTASCPDY